MHQKMGERGSEKLRMEQYRIEFSGIESIDMDNEECTLSTKTTISSGNRGKTES